MLRRIGNMKRAVLGVLVLAVCGMMVAPMGMAGKPQPPPSPVEPKGDLEMTSADQLLLRIDGYVRVYDWANAKFSHTWSGVAGDNFRPATCAIGDVDNDDYKEVVSGSIYTSGKGKNAITTYSIKIWNDGDASDSPSMTKAVSGPIQEMEIGDVDKDDKNELVMIVGSSSVQVWDCDTSGCTKQSTIDDIGNGGLTVADSDNDGYDEILVGIGLHSDTIDRLGHGIVVDYSGGSYSIAGDLGPANTRAVIDELSVGDLDGVAGNEIFGSGYCNGNLYVWRYSDGEYTQVWNGQHKACFDQSNEIADIDGDGGNEIVFTSNSMDGAGADEVGLTIYEYSGDNVWVKSATYTPCGASMDMAVSGDPDGDGEAELVVMGGVWDWDGTAMVKVQSITDPAIGDNAMG